MKPFMDIDFLLTTETAKNLYHEHAEKMPIYDYHNHLSPKDIAEHRRFYNLTELWLEGDHYKWRAMRANGVPEIYVSGKADAFSKFMKWAETVPKLIGSPMYHWIHLELQRYFGITEVLNENTAQSIWNMTCAQMKNESFDTVTLLKKMNVKTLCTTDDPGDDLSFHKMIKNDPDIPFRVLPSFRPDKYIFGDKETLKKNQEALCEKYKTKDIKLALKRAVLYFKENGCLVSDHGLSDFPYGKDEAFTELMDHLGALYKENGIVMQIHLGAIRNNSKVLFDTIGADAGADSVGRTSDIQAISSFLSNLQSKDCLPKTIMYNLNPNDNMVLSTMAGNFAPLVQFGAAWWFNDHIRGIRAQLDELMETYSLFSSVGMLTDSRSFTSFPRHEYFRRILCDKIGSLVEDGMYPYDEEMLGKIIENVCYYNASAFIG